MGWSVVFFARFMSFRRNITRRLYPCRRNIHTIQCSMFLRSEKFLCETSCRIPSLIHSHPTNTGFFFTPQLRTSGFSRRHAIIASFLLRAAPASFIRQLRQPAPCNSVCAAVFHSRPTGSVQRSRPTNTKTIFSV